MRFSLQDIKKHIQRRGEELHVSLHFLRPNELRAEITQLIAYHERLLGQPQHQFSLDEANSCIGDYRLAHCLIATLSHWYTRRPPDWTESLEDAWQVGLAEETWHLHEGPLHSSAAELMQPQALALADITSPIHLRLAFFDYVNKHHHGFLDAQTRPQALQTFATFYQFSVPTLEYLLALDGDEAAILVRDTTQPPTADEVAALYNQWAFEAALSNASNIHFVLDCTPFIEKQQANPAGKPTLETGIGAVIKRLCYLARRFGVYYDLAYDANASNPTNVPSKAAAKGAPTLHLTLYGPQEMTGLPQQYGQRLARLSRLLLGYGNVGGSLAGPLGGPVGNTRKSTAAKLPAKAILQAKATIHFLQRPYSFVIDNNLLKLLPTPSTNAPTTPTPLAMSAPLRHTLPTTPETLFDSSIEQTFAEAFSALESSQGVDGWHLEREPEPLLLEQGLLIPDFALTRADRRLYFEIIGFWTPAYRERKLHKLHQLQGRADLLLAIPVEARPVFAPIASEFAIVWYDGQLSATDLLQVLRTQYDDFPQRLAMLDLPAVRQHIQIAGLVSEQACYQVLHCYRRSELQPAAERIINENIDFATGVGLFHIATTEQLRHSFVEWIGLIGASSLATVLQESRTRWPILATCEDTALEALLNLWPELRIRRTSIFDAVVEIDNGTTDSEEVVEGIQDSKKQVRERRMNYKKRVIAETAQDDLWG